MMTGGVGRDAHAVLQLEAVASTIGFQALRLKLLWDGGLPPVLSANTNCAGRAAPSRRGRRPEKRTPEASAIRRPKRTITSTWSA
jgi:hypothetical protein